MSSVARKREFLTDRDLADMGIANVRTLQTWRLLGRGPSYIKVGRAVRYRLADVEDWLTTRTVTPGAKCQAIRATR